LLAHYPDLLICYLDLAFRYHDFVKHSIDLVIRYLIHPFSLDFIIEIN